MGDAEIPETRDLHALFSSNTFDQPLSQPSLLLGPQCICHEDAEMHKHQEFRMLRAKPGSLSQPCIWVCAKRQHVHVTESTYGRTSILYQLCTFLCLIVCVHLYIVQLPVHFLTAYIKKFSFQQWNLVKFLKDTKGMKMRVRL